MNEQKSILSEFRKMFNLIKRYSHSDLEEFKNVELTVMQGMVLGYIVENYSQNIFQRDIEKAFNIRRSTVTNIIKAIEAKGYIKRESVKNDARLKKIILTTRSKKLSEILMDKTRQLEDKMKYKINEKELQIFFDVIDKINKNLEEK